MSIIRVLFRGTGFFLTTVGLYSIYLAGRGICFLFRLDPTAWRIGVVRLWAKALAGIINLKIDIKGTPPDPPFFLVSNHLSYIDILPYFISMNCVFVAKNEIKRWPMLGRMAQGINIIFINRELKRDIPRVNQLIERNIHDRQGIVIFPEGTTTKGKRVKKFKSSLLHYAASQKFPVSYASIMYSTPDPQKPAHKWVCWWGEMTFLDHFLKLLTLPSIRATVRFGDQAVTENDRKKLAQGLQQKVEYQFTPTVKEKKTYG